MKTLRCGTTALAGLPVRLIEDSGAYSVVFNGEAYAYGRDATSAEHAFASIASGSIRSPRRVSAHSLKMPLRAIAAALTLAFTVSASTADAKPPRRPVTAMVAKAAPKPVLCTAGSRVQSDDGVPMGFMCTDGKRPRLLVRWVEVPFVDSEGTPSTYIIGWSTAPVSS